MKVSEEKIVFDNGSETPFRKSVFTKYPFAHIVNLENGVIKLAEDRKAFVVHPVLMHCLMDLYEALDHFVRNVPHEFHKEEFELVNLVDAWENYYNLLGDVELPEFRCEADLVDAFDKRGELDPYDCQDFDLTL